MSDDTLDRRFLRLLETLHDNKCVLVEGDHILMVGGDHDTQEKIEQLTVNDVKVPIRVNDVKVPVCTMTREEFEQKLKEFNDRADTYGDSIQRLYDDQVRYVSDLLSRIPSSIVDGSPPNIGDGLTDRIARRAYQYTHHSGSTRQDRRNKKTKRKQRKNAQRRNRK